MKIGSKLEDITRDIEILGKINIATINESPIKVIESENDDDTIIREINSVRNIANFAFIPEYEDCYMDIEFIVRNARGDVVKTDSFNNVFVVEYKEKFNYDDGDGEIYILLRERKCK